MLYLFDGHCLDPGRRELRRNDAIVALEPQVFDLLLYLVDQRERVVAKDELLAAIWKGRVVSDSTISSRIAAVRHAIGDSGGTQGLIRTFARKGFRFVGQVREQRAVPKEGTAGTSGPGGTADNLRPLPLTGAVGGERRLMTIMNCRIAETQPLSAHAEPEDLRESMAAQVGCIRSVVERHEGFVVHCTADGLLVYFGFPQIREDDVERAIRAGLEAIRASAELDRQHAGKRRQIRIGIATGLVVIGDSIDADDAARYVVLGEAPFLAARMASLCSPDMVVISSATRHLAGGLFDYREVATPGETRSGSSDGASHVIGESRTTNRFEALRSGGTALVGREEELALLQRRWDRAATGEGRVVLVAGEPGIGKSHLVAAFQGSLGDEAQGCLRYFCSPHRTRTALYPVISLLEGMAGLDRGDDDASRVEKLERLARPFAVDTGRSVALLAELLSIPTGQRYAPLALSAQRRKELVLQFFVAQIVHLAARHRLLIVLEDAHWIDPTTAELFDLLVERVRLLPVLLLMTYRPEFEAPWLGQSHVTALLLNRLGPEENAMLVKQVAGGKPLPASVLQRIVAQTDGVPLFVEEVTKSVLESGVLSEHGDGYVLVGALPGPAVPSTLRASLAARLERLAGARPLMQTCAALGREFSYALLKSVTALPAGELDPLLGQLVASGLVHQRGVVPGASYMFKHALVQEAAYDTLLREQRAQIHRRIVDVFEHEFVDVRSRQPDVMAYHCTQAGLWDKAIDSWIRAARMACDRSAGVEAQAQVDMAMRLLPQIAPGASRQQLEGRLQVALADALTMTKGFASPDVMTALSKARKLLDATIHPVESLGALCGLFNYHMIRSESPDCLALAKPLLRKKLDAPTATIAHYLAGTAHLHLGNFDRSIRHLETALSRYDDGACRSVAFVAGYHVRSFVLIWLGLGYLYVGSLAQAETTITDAVSDARSRSHPFTLVSALLALARFRQHTRDLQGAIDATEEGAAIAAEQRSPYHASRAGILRAINMIDEGRPIEAIALMKQALDAHRATGANFQSSYNLSRLAQAHARAGRFDRAVELAGKAVTDVERTGEGWWEAEALRIKGEILAAAGPERRGEAEQCFRKAIECAQRQRAKLWELHAAESMARLWSDAGRHSHAQELLADAHRTFGEGQDAIPR